MNKSSVNELQTNNENQKGKVCIFAINLTQTNCKDSLLEIRIEMRYRSVDINIDTVFLDRSILMEFS